jgi:hypothetical protein
MSRASGLAGFSTSISPPSNLNVGVVTATSLTVGGVTVSSAGVAVFSGNVGIGTTTSPTTALDVNGDVTIADKIIHGGDTNTAIRFPAADTFTVETAGVEAMRIDSSARLLVGTSTARNIGVGFQAAIGSQLFIEQTSAGITPATFALNRNDTNGPRVVLGKSRGTALGSNTIVQSGDELGRFDFAGADGTDLETVAAEIKAVVDGTPGANDMPGRLVFSTTAIGASTTTERMRITSDGRLVMGGITAATNTDHSICTPGRLQSDGTYSITTASSANVVIISSGLFLRSTSSIKYKTEVEDAELSYSEALVYGSRPVWYRSLSESDPSDYSYWGFIAEEVAEIDPRMVHWGDDGPEGVQYDRYVVHLVSVIQKQQQRLDVLEARIAALEA